jgi:hypothetical protein
MIKRAPLKSDGAGKCSRWHVVVYNQETKKHDWHTVRWNARALKKWRTCFWMTGAPTDVDLADAKLPALGPRNIRNIKRNDLKAHFNALRKSGCTVSRGNESIKAAKAVFTYAFDSEYVTFNVTQRYPKLQRVDGERRANRGIFSEVELQGDL